MAIIQSGNGKPIYPSGNYKIYESTNFQVGASPVVIDAFTDLGGNHDGNAGYISIDGPGDILVEISKGSGGNYGPQFRLKNDGRIFDLAGEGYRKIRLTHSGTDSSYRVFVE